MAVQISNYFEADRVSAIAGEAMAVGQVVSLGNVGGLREVMKVDSVADLIPGGYGVVMKFSVDPRAVDSSTAPAAWGTRIDSIVATDDVVLVSAGYITYDAADLDASLDPARSGTLPIAGARLGLKAARFAAMGAASALILTTVARVWEVVGTKITIKLNTPDIT